MGGHAMPGGAMHVSSLCHSRRQSCIFDSDSAHVSTIERLLLPPDCRSLRLTLTETFLGFGELDVNSEKG